MFHSRDTRNTSDSFIESRNTALFEEYIENVALIDAENTEKDTMRAIIEINGYIIRQAIYHFLPEDLFVMKDFPSNMGDYIEQLHFENSRLLRML